MKTTRYGNALRTTLCVATLAAIGAAATLPLAMNVLRDSQHAERDTRTTSVTLTCFDREMRAHRCDVAPGAVAVVGK